MSDTAQPPIVALDTETTSLDHWRRQPWEIAMIRRDENDEREVTIQIEDIDLTDADPMSLKISGFYERHWSVRGAKVPHGTKILPEHQAVRLIEDWTHRSHVLGAVPNFDEHTLRGLFQRAGRCWTAHYHLIDIEAMAVGWLYGQAQAVDTGEAPETALPWRSDDLSRACGVEPPSEQERHTALGDARWALRWYDAITRGKA